jgi:CHASE3 domain sensor protein
MSLELILDEQMKNAWQAYELFKEDEFLEIYSEAASEYLQLIKQ